MLETRMNTGFPDDFDIQITNVTFFPIPTKFWWCSPTGRLLRCLHVYSARSHWGAGRCQRLL